ncbi:MAG: hypothetical protein LBB23_00140 [Rickettsiales bacterium]|jgi:hypothetical protein|nr:hypothetical protein [Rickettsiales bacterium]
MTIGKGDGDRKKVGKMWNYNYGFFGLIGAIVAVIAFFVGHDVARIKFSKSSAVVPCEVVQIVKPEVADAAVETLPVETCAAIESLILEKIQREFSERDKDPYNRFAKANLYVDLNLKGCPARQAEFGNLAVRELQIARALINDRYEVLRHAEAVLIYKRLGMQAEAESVYRDIRAAFDTGLFVGDSSDKDELRAIEKRLTE